jgi:hypothetical protein
MEWIFYKPRWQRYFLLYVFLYFYRNMSDMFYSVLLDIWYAVQYHTLIEESNIVCRNGNYVNPVCFIFKIKMENQFLLPWFYITHSPYSNTKIFVIIHDTINFVIRVIRVLQKYNVIKEEYSVCVMLNTPALLTWVYLRYYSLSIWIKEKWCEEKYQ